MTDSAGQATLTGRAILAAGEALAGRRRGLGSLLPFAGPAVMASVAYMDPGNFATNIQAGAKYNYDLLWVVPHAIYVHSGFTQDRIVARTDRARRRLLRFSNREVVLALGLAGLVNMAMVAIAASVFHDGVHDDVAEISTAYHTLIPVLGSCAAGVFLVSLIASGLSSSVVGTIAGQVIMQGFTQYRIPLWLRRLVTMVPAFVIAGAGIDATWALILSQVALSLVLPVPMIALLILTRRRDIMGSCASGFLTMAAATAAAAVVLALNVLLVVQISGVPLPAALAVAG
jgi:manganese transport protein